MTVDNIEVEAGLMPLRRHPAGTVVKPYMEALPYEKPDAWQPYLRATVRIKPDDPNMLPVLIVTSAAVGKPTKGKAPTSGSISKLLNMVGDAMDSLRKDIIEACNSVETPWTSENNMDLSRKCAVALITERIIQPSG